MFLAPDGSRMFANFAGIDGAPASSTTRVPPAKSTTVQSPAAVNVTSSGENVNSTRNSEAPATPAHNRQQLNPITLFIARSAGDDNRSSSRNDTS